jgi:flagellar biosynthetic protein FliR
MDIFGFDSVNFLSFVLTLMRVSVLIFFLPFFGGDTIPTPVKAALCLVLALAIWPAGALPGEVFPAHPFHLVLIFLGELILGLGLALLVNFVFAGMQLGAELIGFQMGFSMISLMDPSNPGQQLVITSFLAQMVALALFLSLDGHLLLLSSLLGSFKLMGPGELLLGSRALEDMLSLSAGMFVLAVKVAGPVLACLFLVELALALMARVAPQMNLLVLGFPIKIGVGFFFFGVIFSLIGLYLDDFVRGIPPLFNNFIRAVKGG